MTALDAYLRRDVLPALPDQALVVIAGRGAPDHGWFAGGWEALTARLDLGALAPQDARRLLAAHGLSDDRVPAIIDWAAGSPLALALAADAAIADPGWNAASGRCSRASPGCRTASVPCSNRSPARCSRRCRNMRWR